jgi:hypothetical protein
MPLPSQTRTKPQDWRAKIFQLYSSQRFWNNLNYKTSVMPKHELESDEQVTPTPSSTGSIAQLDLKPPLAPKIKPKASTIPEVQVTPTPYSTDSKAELDLNIPQTSRSSYESPYLRARSEAAAIVGGRPFGLLPQSQQAGAVLGLDSKPLKSSPSSSPAPDVSSPGNAVAPDVAVKIESSHKSKVSETCRKDLLVWLLLTWNT